MRKIVLSGITALSLIAIGLTLAAPVSDHTVQAAAEGSGADVRATAMIDRARPAVVVADTRLTLHATSLMVAEAEGSRADVRPIVAAALFPPADTGRG
jgi:hypothetical protein